MYCVPMRQADAAVDCQLSDNSIDAVEIYATVGEVCGTLEQVFGAFEEPIRF